LAGANVDICTVSGEKVYGCKFGFEWLIYSEGEEIGKKTLGAG
jgi:hypothetical protein